jgi:hypothetical protein
MGYGGVLGGVNSLLFGAPPKPPDSMALANQQTQANRPDQTTPYGQSNWSQDANGNWSQNVSFSPGMQGANDSLMTQWGQNAANGYGTGDDARRQSTDAAWSQFQRMSNPLMQQREDKSKSDMLNMGLDMGSTGFNTGMGNTLQANDNLRLNAMDQSIAAGDRAQAQTFNQNRQQWLDPLSAMQGMQSMLTMPNVPGAGGYQQAGQNQFANEMTQYGANQDTYTGLINGAGQVAGAIGGMPPSGMTGGFGGGGSAGGNFAYGASPYSPGQLQPPKF